MLDAYMLLHDGARALSVVEHNGIRIDESRLKEAKQQAMNQLKEIESKMKKSNIYKQIVKRYGTSSNIGSRDQLSKILSTCYHIALPQTETNRFKLDESVLESIKSDDQEVSEYLELFSTRNRLEKLISTYLMGFEREIVDGYIHPVFNLHLVKTYRSSSESPNLQNIPTRMPEIAKLIRSSIVPRENHVLVEIDYSALEFRVAACVWNDPNMIEYASNPEKDVHRDFASRLYLVKPSEVNKQIRNCGKSLFVFPQLYGDYYINCARNLWEAIDKYDLTVNGLSMKQHLANNDIEELGSDALPFTFTGHVKSVEDEFYHMFNVLSERQQRLWNEYKQTGYVKLITGFIVRGVYKKTFILNCVIQGPAFHLLLWSLTELVKWTISNKMKTKIIGEVHDSILADVHKDELDLYIDKAIDVMTKKIKQRFDWIVTPMNVEVEICETNWYDKKPYRKG